jgi:hypothetical protein
MKRFATKQFFKREHEKMIIIDNYVYIGSSNIGDEYDGFEYLNNVFIDINMRLKNVISWEAQQTIEHIILKHKAKKHLDSKTSKKKRKMLDILKTIPHRYNSLYLKKNTYGLMLSKCGKKVEIQDDLIQNVNLIRSFGLKNQFILLLLITLTQCLNICL